MKWNAFVTYVRGLVLPIAVLAVLVVGLFLLLQTQADFYQNAEDGNLREWIKESIVFRKTLSDLAREYLDIDKRKLAPVGSADRRDRLRTEKAQEIREQLHAMCDPVKMYQGQLPLFPVVYRLELRLRPDRPSVSPHVHSDQLLLVWDSNLPRDSERFLKTRTLHVDLLKEEGLPGQASIALDYILRTEKHAQQQIEHRQRIERWVLLLAVAAPLLAAGWVYVFWRREQERERQQFLAQQDLHKMEKLAMENKLRHEEVERQRHELERHLLEQRIVLKEAEQRALELKSQLYASIGVMAGSYAHNIKNLLVRPHDLLQRCLEVNGLAGQQRDMLTEVQGTLHTVTERLQEILKTVRRDPSKIELCEVDLNQIVQDVVRHWQGMAQDKWKLTLVAQIDTRLPTFQADRSHLIQAVENLMFNARDATFEMRNAIREEARANPRLSDADRRSALIEAAAWRGHIIMKTIVGENEVIFEVQDNGIGMSAEVVRRCTEAHFSTKRHNALYEGNTTGMGLGLAFVRAVLENHRAQMEIGSTPRQGTTFRLRFPTHGQGGKASGGR